MIYLYKFHHPVQWSKAWPTLSLGRIHVSVVAMVHSVPRGVHSHFAAPNTPLLITLNLYTGAHVDEVASNIANPTGFGTFTWVPPVDPNIGTSQMDFYQLQLLSMTGVNVGFTSLFYIAPGLVEVQLPSSYERKCCPLKGTMYK